ncbi:MAG: PilZ domain-containing protein [Candidatus Omnitrophota bacterium]
MKRVVVNFILSYKVREPIAARISLGNREVNARMFDLSHGGMGILTDLSIPQLSVLSTRFVLLDPYAFKSYNKTRVVDTVGETRYNILYEKNERRIGVRFTSITAKEKSSIYDFVKWQSIYSSLSSSRA